MALIVAPAMSPGALAGALGPLLSLGAATPAPHARAGSTELLIVALGAAVVGLLWYADVIRPGSFRRASPRDPRAAAGDRVGGWGEGSGGVGWHLWLLGAIMTHLALLTAAGLTASLLGAGPGTHPGVRTHAIVGLVAYTTAAAAGLALVALFSTRAAAPSAGLRARWSDLPVGVGLIALAAPVLLASSVISVMVYAWLTGAEPDPVAHTQLRMILESRTEGGGIDPWVWPLALSAAVGAPVVEELTHRIFLQTSLLTLTRSHWAAVLTTSAIFTAVHAGSVPFYAMPVLFTLSVAIGVAYERTGRLLVPITMHAAFNAANLAATLLGPA